MKKIFSLMIAAFLCMIYHPARAALTLVDGVYQIGTAAELNEYAQLVNSGDLARYRSVILTADIDYTAYTTKGDQIGSESGTSFRGVFDGNGHTITINMVAEEKGASLFRYMNGTVRNLKVAGTLTTAYKNCGGICAYIAGSIENSVSSVHILTSVSGDGTQGGLAGSTSSDSKIVGSVWNGKIEGPTTTRCGGLVGWNTKSLYVDNSLAIGEMDISVDSESNTIARGSGYCGVTHTYYLSSLQTNDISVKGEAITPDDLQSGRAAFLTGMNQTNFDTPGSTPSPALDYITTQPVYPVGSVDCSGEGATSYTNDYAASVPHNYEDHVCTVCGKYDMTALPRVGKFYQLASVDDVTLFAKMVNAGYHWICGQLTADIDFKNITNFPMIGTKNPYGYNGTFDGNYHKIKNLKIENQFTNNVGFFQTLTTGAIIQNLTADEGCVFYGLTHVGFIGHSDRAGCIRLNGLGNEGVVKASNTKYDAGVGGIIGNCNNGNTGIIENCWFTGNIPSGTSCSYICGWAGKDQFVFSNCWSSSVSSRVKPEESITRFNTTVTLLNCYVVDGAQGNLITPEEVKSGKLCYLLNGSSSDNPTWYQQIYTDNYPTLNGSAIVYEVDNKYCDGSVAEGVMYANSQTDYEGTAHKFDGEDGCSLCHFPYEQDGFYQIMSPQNLAKYAEYLNGNKLINQDFRIKNDLDMSGFSWTPIGTEEVPFTGTMYGERHTISQMKTESDVAYAGLFGWAESGSMSDLLIDETCEMTGIQYAGGLVGRVARSNLDINNVGVMCPVSVTAPSGDRAAGGIVGNSGAGSKTNMTNCFSTGPVSSTGDAAQLSGWQGNTGSKIENCWSVATVKDKNGVQSEPYFFRADKTFTVKKCFNTSAVINHRIGTEVAFDLTKVDNVEDVGSGKLAYDMNVKSNALTWYQTIGPDVTPLPWEDHGIVNRVSAAGWATQYIPVTDVTIPEGVETFGGVIEDNALKLQPIYEKISKEDAVVLKAAAGYYSFVPTTGATPSTTSVLHGTNAPLMPTGNEYVLANGINGIGFYLAAHDEIPAYKAYLTPSVPSQGLRIVLPDEGNAIQTVETEKRHSQIFNLKGQRLSRLQRGIQIVDGKKVLVK